MNMRNTRWDCPSKDPEPDGESGTCDNERADFGFRLDGAVLFLELFEEVLVVEAREDV